MGCVSRAGAAADLLENPCPQDGCDQLHHEAWPQCQSLERVHLLRLHRALQRGGVPDRHSGHQRKSATCVRGKAHRTKSPLGGSVHQDTSWTSFPYSRPLAIRPPTRRMRVAATDRTRLAPRFIGLAKEFLTLLPVERPKQTPLFFNFQLLGDWREKAAYRTGAGHERKDADEFRAVLARPTQ